MWLSDMQFLQGVQYDLFIDGKLFFYFFGANQGKVLNMCVRVFTLYHILVKKLCGVC